jgi:hypothetical protein
MRPPLLLPESILEILAQGPPRISAATSGIPDDLLCKQPQPEEWSILDVLVHLRASADVRGDQRIEAMLTGNEPTIRTISPRHWSVTSEYAEQPFSQSLDAFTSQRESLLQRLRSLDPEDWHRGATLTGLGNRRYETVHSEADALTRHEAGHITQIERQATLLESGR